MNIEAKVVAAAAGSGVGAAVGTFLLWLLGVTVWGQPVAADAAAKAVSAVPGPVAGLLVIVVSVVGAALGGYRAPHTARADLGESAPAAGEPASPSLP